MGDIIHSYNIIRVESLPPSREQAEACYHSCLQAGIEASHVQFFSAVDGTTGKLEYPSAGEMFPRLAGLKIANDHLMATEAACYLTHYLLWKKCIELNKPIIILEHDARLLRPLVEFPFRNCILYLGNENTKKFEIVWGYVKAPTLGYKGYEQEFPVMDRTHAYAIDPFVAKNLVIKTLERGIIQPVDISIRMSDFCILMPVPCIATVETGGNSSIADEGVRA